ncbi:hypothetical protein Syun_016274 [Stephania yunnanensis]|uniref:Thioredoxin domain-containing protein n=1 Tax=Stephania yunnanensis TaxID=152371 RepID=A0AAP0P178_9MAGN
MSCATRISSSLTIFKSTNRCSDSPSRLLRIPLQSRRHISETTTLTSRLGSLVVSAEKTRLTASSTVDDPSRGLDSPVSIELRPVLSEAQFDRVIAQAQQLGESVVVLWMASWCRKCIYLKPKLEKLAADYHPRIQFYCIDVNMVPHRLVARAGVTLWKDCKKQDEVIGGHKAHLVINEIREMIENEGNL